MLTPSTRAGATAALFLVAIATGTLLGTVAPGAAETAGALLDPLVLALVVVLFLTLRFDGLPSARRAPRVILLVLGTNFLAIPVIAYALTAPLADDALRLGVMIYALAPCTDWFLGFTRMAGGDTVTGAALIPVQLTAQLLLFPVWLALLSGEPIVGSPSQAWATLSTWFLAPAAAGLCARMLFGSMRRASLGARLLGASERAVPFAIAAVIVAVFATHVDALFADPAAFAWVLAIVFAFFVVTFALGEASSRLLRLHPQERALVTMATSARNAPLMLAVTTVAIPDHPVVSAAIVLGMLVEFPHLAAITYLLARRPPRGRHAPAPRAAGA